jgi:hypothetical protein
VALAAIELGRSSTTVPPVTLWMARASFSRLKPTVSISIPNRSAFIVVVLAFRAGLRARC